MTTSAPAIPTQAPEPIAPLALRPRDAARALGIGPRLLWSLTNQGVIPHVKIGRRVVYPVDLLRQYLQREAQGVPRE